MKKSTYLFALLLALVHIGTAQEEGKDWPQLDGFSERHARALVNYEPPFELVKRIDVGVPVDEFSYMNDTVYFAWAPNNNFSAIDLNTGEIIWTKSVGNTTGSVGVVPALSGNLVYTGGQQAKGLYALDRMTGDSVWFQPIGNMFGRNVAIKGERLYINTSGGPLTCFDKLTGNIQWTFDIYSPQYVCAVDDNQVYYHNKDSIYALNRYSGIVKWKRPYSFEGNIVNMLTHDDRVVIKNGDDLVVYLTTDGSIVYEIELPTGTGLNLTHNTIALAPDSYLIHGWNGSNSDPYIIQRIRQTDGELIWEQELDAFSFTPSITFGDYFAVINYRDFEIRELQTGEVVQTFTDRNYSNRSGIKITEKGILVTDGTYLNVFAPITTSVLEKENKPVAWEILGNPSSGQIQLKIESAITTELSFAISDLQGRRINVEETFPIRPAKQVYTIQTDLPAGVYILTLFNENLRSSKRMVISE